MKHHTRWAVCLLLTFAISILTTHQAFASGCNTEIRKRISFERGATCWSFQGQANNFYGAFGAGQRISVELKGWSADIDTPEWKKNWEPLDPYVSGPVQFFAKSSEPPEVGEDFSGKLFFVAPYKGYYTFTVGPCSYWRSHVRFMVCAR